ncbi:hypothetical protein J6590_104488 [Homalodisca vitripennis]|nr:hypothetical protein J6590_104488 [Homalodisca vitripennis]
MANPGQSGFLHNPDMRSNRIKFKMKHLAFLEIMNTIYIASGAVAVSILALVTKGLNVLKLRKFLQHISEPVQTPQSAKMLDIMSDVMVTECKVAVKQDSECYLITHCHKLNIKSDLQTSVHQCLYHIVWDYLKVRALTYIEIQTIVCRPFNEIYFSKSKFMLAKEF